MCNIYCVIHEYKQCPEKYNFCYSPSPQDSVYFVKLTININRKINTDKVSLFKNVSFIIFYHNNKFVLNKDFSHITS